MKKILVVYYTQTGQLKRIIDSILAGIEPNRNIQIDYLPVEPVKDFPFPWGNEAFFDCFPETVKGVPCKLKPIKPAGKEYDLVILGYQPWYLSPSIPATSFLKSNEAIKMLKGKKVITVIGARNMWTQSQEIIKDLLGKAKAQLVGNIALSDKTDNYVAGITVIRWMIAGKKGPGKLLPEAGVSEKDIREAKRFGEVIETALTENAYDRLQPRLEEAGAVPIKYHLTQIEQNARKIFDIFADYVLRKAKKGDKYRKQGIRLFKYYLLFVFFILSPIFSFIFMVKRIAFFPLANRKIKYFKSTETGK